MQTYKSITFILGFQDTKKEEVIKKDYIKYLKNTFEKDMFLESFLEVFDLRLKFNKYLFSFTNKSNDNLGGRHPSITIYPQEISLIDGSLINFDFNDSYVELCSNAIGDFFKLKWIEVESTLNL
tara:strand:- start:59 stop:430 length:372 start_codon:yes stop_codon:yes gene_type:complete